MALPGKHGLGDAIAPHGPGGGPVGKHRPGVALHIGAGVELGEGVHALGVDAVAVGGVGPLVGERLELPGSQRPVRPDVGDDVGADGVADPVGDKGLLPAALQLHKPSPHLGGAPGAQRLIQRVLLVAKSPADVGLDDPHPSPGHPQGLPHHSPDNVGNLCGADHHHPPRLLIGEAGVVLNVAVLDRWCIVPALDFDEAGLLPGGLIVPPADVGVAQDVVFVLLVELGRAVLHGLLHIQHKGQLLILNLQSPDALGRRHLVPGDDHRHLVAVVADVAVQEQPVGHILMAGVRGPGMTRRGKGDVRHVKTGQDLHHTGNCLRGGGVDGLHKTVGDGGVTDLHHQRLPAAEIVRVPGAARGLFPGVHPRDAFADALAHRESLLLICMIGKNRIYYISISQLKLKQMARCFLC